MHSFYFDQLPDQFGKYFAELSLIHNHETRLVTVEKYNTLE